MAQSAGQAPLRAARRAVPTAAELALTATTAAAVVGMARLFSDTTFLVPLLATVAVGHAVAIIMRRLGANLAVAAAVSGLALLLTLGWAVESHTLTFGLPLGQTWDAIRADLSSAVEAFGQVRAPTPSTPGFVLACAIAAWTCAFAADTFAFRARARFEALVPSFVVFLFGAVLGTERHRLASAAIYLAAVLAFAVLSEPSGRSGRAWFAGRSRSGNRALLRSGLLTALVAVTAALVITPYLPGAHSPGVVDVNDPPGSGSRTTVSPLVDIRARLVNQSRTELFTVLSSLDTYWRVTSLERFDGDIWSSAGSYEPARGSLPSGVPTRPGDHTVVQHFDVKALDSIWLPAAYRPQRLDGVGNVRYDPDSGSLLTDARTSDGMRYSVESALLDLTSDELAGATSRLPSGQSARYLDLPEDFPASARAAAEEVTAADPDTCARLGCSAGERSTGRLTPYHQARALQDWFRTEFTYNIRVDAGHGDSAIEQFLLRKEGYCEQFAGTYAAMARHLGLPSRVAVGFTPGTLGADGRYHVTGEQAHAWPEVYLAPAGWVAFEPTPGRAIPRGGAYTGTGATAAPSPGAQTAAPAATTPTTTGAGTAAQTPTDAAPEDPAADSTDASEGFAWPLSALASVTLLALVGYLGGVPLAHHLRRSRRRSRATTPTARVLLAWSEAEEDLSRAGLGQRPSETASEYAARARQGPVAASGPALADLADQLSSAAYSPTGADEPAARRAEAAAATVRTAVRDDVGPVARTLWTLDPRPLVKGLTRRA